MKKTLLLLALLPALALAGPPDTFNRRDSSESQILTRAAPTLSTEGVQTREMVSVTVSLDAGSGKTLLGAGALDLYLYDRWDGATFSWAKFPNRQQAVPAGCAGQRYCVIEALTVDGPRLGQRMLWATNGVTVSSGTTAVVVTKVSVSAGSVSR